MKDYIQIETIAGDSLDKVLEMLQEQKEKRVKAYVVFNGHKLYSDLDDVDSAYKKVTGRTKSEIDNIQSDQQKKYEDDEAKHKASIPDLTKEWIQKGKVILDEKFHDLWEECVPIRLGDLYRGMELKCCLDIVKPLNDGCELDVVKKIIEDQGHSGMSFGLVCSMVKSFCERGEEFVNYVR